MKDHREAVGDQILAVLDVLGAAENEPSPRLLIPVDWEGLKEDFRAWVRALLPRRAD